MILVGNQRGGAHDLARHLMKDENERVVVHDLRGFVGQTLDEAFQESEAIARGTRCKQHLFSLSLNPPKAEEVGPGVFEDAIARAEEALGLSGQPRAIVFHEKIGADGELRRHAHAVWCRIDAENMRAVQLSFTKRKLQDLARDLYREHDWKMPRGFVRHEERNPANYTLAEWQQAKRAGRDPAKLKQVIQDCWLISDCGVSFTNALKENGFILARGDKRGAVAVDHTGEAFSISRAVSIKAKQVRTRLGDLDRLPDTGAAHAKAAKLVTDRLETIKEDQRRIAGERLHRITAQREQLKEQQRLEAQRLETQLSDRQRREEQERNARIRKGWRGLVDRLTGRKRKIEAENLLAASASEARDQLRRDQLREAHRLSRLRHIQEARSSKTLHRANIRELSADVAEIRAARTRAEEDRSCEVFKEMRRRKPASERPKRRRSRDGPAPSR